MSANDLEKYFSFHFFFFHYALLNCFCVELAVSVFFFFDVVYCCVIVGLAFIVMSAVDDENYSNSYADTFLLLFVIIMR